MIGHNNSYFDKELCLDGHYIITGYTNDLFCNDLLQVSDLKYELHYYLRNTEKFDAVVFFDSYNMLHCYDQQSYDILRGNRLNNAKNDITNMNTISSSGPIGHRRRARNCSVTPPDTSQSNNTTVQLSERWNMGLQSTKAAWMQVTTMLKHENKYRCALVCSNMDSLFTTMDSQALTVLEDLQSFHGSERNDNQSIVIYIFRETTISSLCDGINQIAGVASSPWSRFYQNVLLKRIDSKSIDSNRVISLRTPNRLEIKNLINSMRFQSEDRLHVEMKDIDEIAAELAGSCARQKWGLKNLKMRLELCIEKNPNRQLSIQNVRDFTGESSYKSPMERINSLIGLDDKKDEKGLVNKGLKTYVREWYAENLTKTSINDVVGYSRLLPLPFNNGVHGHELNICLKGAPGTGKSTIARLMGELYYQFRKLPQGQCIECSAADLISGYVGDTPSRVRNKVQEALGGVLFIDEAYALAPERDRNGNITNEHGLEAINQLVNDMSSYAGQLAVIIAGYPDKIDRLLKENDGLAGRFPNVITIDDYSPNEMRSIFEKMVNDDEDNVVISDELRNELPNFFEAWVGGKIRGWRNAGEAETLLSSMKKRCSLRMQNDDTASKRLILKPEDIPENLQHCLEPRSQNIEQAIADIDNMIGLSNVKAFLKTLVNNIRMGAEERVPGNYIFSGGPGTGKTTVARKMGEILGHLHVLNRKVNNVVECRAADLLNGSKVLSEIIQDARGGILFIDEAHQLEKDSNRGHAIIRELVPLIEDPEIHSDTCVICAGYTVDMNRFLNVDQGLSRRFPHNHRIRFDDYTASELVQILEKFAFERGEITDTDDFRAYLLRSKVAFEKYLQNKPLNFGNAGFIRDVYLPESIAARTRRLNRKYMGKDDSIITENLVNEISDDERRTLTADDIPASFVQFAGPLGRIPKGERNAKVLLSELYGKDEFTDYIESLYSDKDDGLFFDGDNQVGMHYSIAGPEGSGRHTAISAMALARKELGFLEKADVIYVGKADLEAGYLGQTAIKTQSIVDQAVGGTLVITYPSSMIPKNANDNSYGQDALGVIINAMSEHFSDLCVVFLDSDDGMNEFFKSYPSIRSHLSKQFIFDDLSYNDMYNIFLLKTKNSILFDEEINPLIPDMFLNWVSDRGGLTDSISSWGNGRELDQLIDDLIRNWKHENGSIVSTVVAEGDSSFSTNRRLITQQMIPDQLKKYLVSNRIVSDNALSELESMVGLESVKKSIRVIERRMRRMPNGSINPGIYCYVGNPGVGKTTVAKLMGGILKATGVLSQGHVIVRTARQLCDNVDDLDKSVKLAKNGILFIDEAHQLAENIYGKTVIKKLLTIVEDKTIVCNTCIILAGYPRDMAHLFELDDGLASRFGTANSIIRFEDYTPEELCRILEDMSSRADSIIQIGTPFAIRLSDGYLARSLEIFESIVKQGNKTFGNARFVRNYLHDSVDEMLERLDNKYGKESDIPQAEKDFLTEEDIPKQYRGIAKKTREKVIIPSVDILAKGMQKITDENLENVFSEYSQSVVLLESFVGNNKKGEGTGTIVTESGFVLTCAHILRGATRIRARVYSPGMVGGDYRWFDCDICDSSYDDCDLSIVKLKGENFKPIKIRPANSKIKIDEETLLIGFPLGAMIAGNNIDELAASHFSGRIASVQAIRDIERYYIDITGLHGNSGSPVISKKDGFMIGVFSGSIVPKAEKNLDELNYFYPIKYFWDRYTIGKKNK